MRSSHSMKKEFLKKWMMGLQVCVSSKKKMTVLERKKAIKLSADIAMASSSNGNTCWSRALIVNASKHHNNKLLIERILGRSEYEKLIKRVSSTQPLKKITRSKKIFKRSCSRLRRVEKRNIRGCKRVINGAYCVAKNLVKKRRKILRSLVPGGEMIVDDVCLIEETLDYILSLRAQVDVMRSVADACDQS
ncbi:putative sequence-specific DNA binding transcription factor [Tripterygium wilfordii]|uniref:Putative sequence-specific DNA binding transcription factor n=1 Tax=Tripterygium wilfordii TaxID=458696 RepID=A0A7J7DSW9_TRIWF|nr:transcription factor IBH1-like 1 [Tripterygium wilfordii]KAF5749465.1 putative sequence-specific DNA binding transcription factor [Tripterygium wilfordii]